MDNEIDRSNRCLVCGAYGSQLLCRSHAEQLKEALKYWDNVAKKEAEAKNPAVEQIRRKYRDQYGVELTPEQALKILAAPKGA